MTTRLARAILRWWRQKHPKAAPCAADELARFIPAYRDAMSKEAIAKRKTYTQALSRARKAKKRVVEESLRAYVEGQH